MEKFVFSYGGTDLKVFLDGKKPWYVAKEIFAILGIKNQNQGLGKLDPDQIRMLGIKNEKTRRMDYHLSISESGIYSLACRSRNAEAPAFYRWLLDDVAEKLKEAQQAALKTKIEELEKSILEEKSRTQKTVDYLQRTEEIYDSVSRELCQVRENIQNLSWMEERTNAMKRKKRQQEEADPYVMDIVTHDRVKRSELLGKDQHRTRHILGDTYPREVKEEG